MRPELTILGRFPSGPRRAVIVGWSLLVAGGATACATIPPRNPFEEAGRRTRIQVDVTNDNVDDATIHAFRGPTRLLVGTVRGRSSGSFTLDWPGELPLQFEIRLFAGGRCVTAPMEPSNGYGFFFQIERVLETGLDCLDLNPGRLP